VVGPFGPATCSDFRASAAVKGNLEVAAPDRDAPTALSNAAPSPCGGSCAYLERRRDPSGPAWFFDDRDQERQIPAVLSSRQSQPLAPDHQLARWARSTPRRSDALMADRAMDVYLNNHLAGAMLESDLAEQIRRRHEHTLASASAGNRLDCDGRRVCASRPRRRGPHPRWASPRTIPNRHAAVAPSNRPAGDRDIRRSGSPAVKTRPAPSRPRSKKYSPATCQSFTRSVVRC
jgi:hypothetical protein